MMNEHLIFDTELDELGLLVGFCLTCDWRSEPVDPSSDAQTLAKLLLAHSKAEHE